MAETREEEGREYRCSFCNKTRGEVRKMIAGPRVYICDECVALCEEIIHSDPDEPERLRVGYPSPVRRGMTEEEVREVLGAPRQVRPAYSCDAGETPPEAPSACFWIYHQPAPILELAVSLRDGVVRDVQATWLAEPAPVE